MRNARVAEADERRQIHRRTPTSHAQQQWQKKARRQGTKTQPEQTRAITGKKNNRSTQKETRRQPTSRNDKLSRAAKRPRKKEMAQRSQRVRQPETQTSTRGRTRRAAGSDAGEQRHDAKHHEIHIKDVKLIEAQKFTKPKIGPKESTIALSRRIKDKLHAQKMTTPTLLQRETVRTHESGI